MEQSANQTLKDVRLHLQRLHSAFLESLRYRFERVAGQPVGGGRWLGVLSHDPDYAWIRPITQILAQIDETLEEEKISDEQYVALQTTLDQLLKPGSGHDFSNRFFEMLPNEPDLMMNFHHFREAKKHYDHALKSKSKT